MVGIKISTYICVAVGMCLVFVVAIRCWARPFLTLTDWKEKCAKRRGWGYSKSKQLWCAKNMCAMSKGIPRSTKQACKAMKFMSVVRMVRIVSDLLQFLKVELMAPYRRMGAL